VFEIAGKHVLVTGASSGLGRHFAKMLAGKGARVTLAARRVDALTSAVEEIKQAGGCRSERSA
jgi:short-subunit dehydrogenase